MNRTVNPPITNVDSSTDKGTTNIRLITTVNNPAKAAEDVEYLIDPFALSAGVFVAMIFVTSVDIN